MFELPLALRWCAVAVFVAGPLIAESIPTKSLRGLSKLRILVAINQDAEAAGISRERLQDTIAQKLKDAGLEIIDWDVKENLYLSVDAQKIEQIPGAYQFLLQWELHQPSTLKRDPQIELNGITWRINRAVLAPDNAVERVDRLVDGLIEDFLKAHGNENQPQKKARRPGVIDRRTYG